MIKKIGNTRVQEASDGMLLTDGETFSKLVYLGDGVKEWVEVVDDGQLEPDTPVLD